MTGYPLSEQLARLALMMGAVQERPAPARPRWSTFEEREEGRR